MNSEEYTEANLTKNGKNAFNAHCKIAGCNLLLFRSNMASWTEYEYVLPYGQKEETVRYFWCFGNIFDLENMAFTKDADLGNIKIKYLACCDCEHGPIGFQDLETKNCYVAVDRINYEKS